MNKKLFGSILKLILITAAVILLLIRIDDAGRLLSGLVTLFTPLVAGFGIAFVLHRPFRFFRRVFSGWLAHRHKYARLAGPLAVLVSYVLLLAVVALLTAFVLPEIVHSIQTFAGNLGDYIVRVQAWINTLESQFDLEFLQGVDLSILGDAVRNMLGEASLLFSSAMPQLFSLTSTLVSGVVNTFLALIFSVYMLAGSDKLLAQSRRVVQAYLPKRVVSPLLEVTRLAAETFTNYVTGQFIEACILGTLCTLGMWILRFPYAPLVGVIIGVSALIPVVGAFFGATLSALLLAVVNPITALWFLLYIIILQQIETNLIAPRVVGRAVGLPAIWVLAAVIIGSGVFGFVGALIGVPAASVLYALLRQDLQKRLPKPEGSDERTENRPQQ